MRQGLGVLHMPSSCPMGSPPGAEATETSRAWRSPLGGLLAPCPGWESAKLSLYSHSLHLKNTFEAQFSMYHISHNLKIKIHEKKI